MTVEFIPPQTRTIPATMDLHNTWPKYLTLVLAIPLLPRCPDDMVPFMVIGLVFCLLCCHFSPDKVHIPTSFWDKIVIGTNLFLTYLSGKIFVETGKDYIQSVDSLTSLPWKQLIYPLCWVTIEETLFYLIHKFFHQPGIYEKCHKMHHKFKTTSAWTSFYSHPFDQLFAILWTALGPPLLQLRVLQIPVCAPIVTLWLFGAIITFTVSHHTVKGSGGHAEGSDHLEHHQKFNVNFGNFGYYDMAGGSYAGRMEQREKNRIKDEKRKVEGERKKKEEEEEKKVE